MSWFFLVNLALVFFSFWVAERCKSWSFSWWLNMFASATNAAIVMFLLSNQLSNA